MPLLSLPGADVTRTVRAVLFDMDGTLVSSEPVADRAWTRWARRHGLDTDRVVVSAHGRPTSDTVRQWLPGAEPARWEREIAWLLEYECGDLDGVTAIPGALELLAVVREAGLPWAVVTSAERPLATVRLAACAIAPPLLVCVEDVARGKPEPDGYLLAAAGLGVDPADCLVVEDSEVGVEAGRRAGARTVGLGEGGWLADHRIGSLLELVG